MNTDTVNNHKPQSSMSLLEAASKRHSVRKYLKAPLSKEIIEKLNERALQNNKKFGLSIKLMVDSSDAFSPIIKMFLAKGVKNYFIMAADPPKRTPAERGEKIIAEKLGYAGADLMLYAQTLGLNTWWVGGTFNRKATNEFMNGKIVIAVIAVGYGKTQGKKHKTKTMNKLLEYAGKQTPEWFTNGVSAAMLAPTAFGSQQFRLLGKHREVEIRVRDYKFGAEESGLIKYHFELGAGKDNFKWKTS